MHRQLVFCLAIAFLVVPARADEKAKKKADPVQAEFEALVEKLQAAKEEAGKTYKAAKSDKERQAVREKYQQTLRKMAGPMLALAQKYPQHELAFQAIDFVVRAAPDSQEAGKALDIIVKDFPKEIPPIAMLVVQTNSPHADAFLKAALAKATTRDGKAILTYSMAELAKTRAENAEPESAEAAKYSKEAESLYEQVIKSYHDVDKVTKLAEKELFALRNLAIGKVAPDIQGDDSAGKKFKLSDYRGKVVLLDFWASWCGPCMALVPHARDLVKQYKDQPFAMVGVNSDNSEKDQKECEEKNEMSWRSFHDGREGPICDKWNISGIPTIYVLDPKGVIRFKAMGFPGEEVLARKVDELIKETKQTSGKK